MTEKDYWFNHSPETFSREQKKILNDLSGYDIPLDWLPTLVEPPDLDLTQLGSVETLLANTPLGDTTPRHLQVFLMRVLEDKTFKVIADELGLSPGGTRITYRRGLNNIGTFFIENIL